MKRIQTLIKMVENPEESILALTPDNWLEPEGEKEELIKALTFRASLR